MAWEDGTALPPAGGKAVAPTSSSPSGIGFWPNAWGAWTIGACVL